MPVSTTITSHKFFNQFTNNEDFLANASDFTENLAGGTIEKIKAETQLQIKWFAEASTSDRWTFTKNTSTNWTIERANGDFVEDGFWVGAYCFLDTTNAPVSNITIDFISNDGRTINVTSDSTTSVADGEWDFFTLLPIASDSSNSITSLIMGYNILGQNEQYNNISKVSGNAQQFYFTSLSIGGGAQAGIAKGSFNDWVTGAITCERLSNADDYTQVFSISHIFNVTPYYLDGEISNLQDNVPTDLYLNSLKYAFDVDFRTVLSNPNKSIKAIYDNVLGSVGWFNQNFNGFDNQYQIDSIEYEDSALSTSVDGLQISSKTRATITVSRIGGVIASGQRAGVFISYLPSQSEYQNTTTTLEENYIFDSLYHNEGDSAEVGTGVIKSFDSSIVSDTLEIVVEFEYSIVEQLRITTDSNYLISVQIADSSLSSGNSNRVNLLADVNNYRKGAFIEGLFNINNFGYLVNGQALQDAPELEVSEIWNEDSINVKGEFDLDLSKESFLNSLEFSLVALNSVTEEYFLLDTYLINTASSIVSGGVQQIEFDQNRGYTQVFEEDVFNIVRVNTGAKVGDLQSYSFNFSQKLKWQDWNFNPNADTAFFDSSKLQNNLNFKSSNYSNIDNYQIKVIVIANTTGIDDLGRSGVGKDTYVGGNLIVKDYSESSTSYTVASVKTLDPNTLIDLNGAVLSDRPTLIESRFSVGSVPNLKNKLILHRYEKANQLGDVIPEIEATLSVDGNDLVGQTLISESIFDIDTSYNFTARLFSPFQILFFDTNWDLVADGNFVATVAFNDSTIATWLLPDGTQVTGNSLNTALGGFDGAEKTVKLLVPNFSALTNFDVTAKIINTLDLSVLSGAERIDVRSNPNMTEVITATNVLGDFDGFRANGSGLVGVASFSNTLFTNTAFVDLTSNTGLNDVEFSTDLGLNSLSDLRVSNCDIEGVLDCSNASIQTIQSTSGSPNWTGINLYSGAVVNGDTLIVLGANLTGVLDLTYLAVSSITVQFQSLTEVILSSLSKSMGNISLNGQNIRTIDFGGAQFSGFVTLQFQNLNDDGLMTSAQISQIVVDIASRASSGSGVIRFDGNNPSLDASGMTAKTALEGLGYTVLFN